jgi:hypothetical protein
MVSSLALIPVPLSEKMGSKEEMTVVEVRAGGGVLLCKRRRHCGNALTSCKQLGRTAMQLWSTIMFIVQVYVYWKLH